MDGQRARSTHAIGQEVCETPPLLARLDGHAPKVWSGNLLPYLVNPASMPPQSEGPAQGRTGRLAGEAWLQTIHQPALRRPKRKRSSSPTRPCSRRNPSSRQEEGAANRLMGWAGADLDRDRRGDEPVPPLCGLRDRADPGTALHPRRVHAGAELPAVSGGDAVPQPRALVGHRSRHFRGRDHRLCAVGRRRFYRPRHLARPPGRHRRHRLHRAGAGGDAAHHRADHAGGLAVLHRLCDARSASARALDPSRLRPAAAGRPSLHHAGRHFRRRGRRLGDADHPVHDLRRVPAAIRRRKILHRFLAGADGRQSQQRRAHRGAVVVPARRTVGLRRRHHGDDRHRRLSDAGQGRL